jgi:acetoacetate decarboxylase
VTATTWTIEDHEVTLPVEVREATSLFATFLVPARAVQRVLPPGLTPLQAIPGRAVCTIVAVDYRDGDLGAYHELGVCFLLRPAGSRLDLLAMARNRAPAYIHRLPVTTSFSCEAGRRIWGFPKTVMDVRLSGDTCTLTDGERHVLTLSAPVDGGRERSFRDQDIQAVGACDGTALLTHGRMGGSGVRMKLRGGRLTLGNHALADELRALGLPKRPLAAGSIAHLTMSWEAAHPLK